MLFRNFFKLKFFFLSIFLSSIFFLSIAQENGSDDIGLLVGAMLSETPIRRDLHELCDKIGGRVTGTKANLKAVEWGFKKFEEAGVKAKKESFNMPKMWSEKFATAEITGAAHFHPRIVSRAFSVATPAKGLSAELIFAGFGKEEDFKKLGTDIKDKFILVETEVLTDMGRLFGEYMDAHQIEERALSAGVKGVVYMSSRPKKLLFRHLASKGYLNTLPLIAMARDDATRCKRIIKKGGKLNLDLKIDLETGGEYESFNVIGEIEGSIYPDEIIVIGAHLDSWGLGTGAQDNGCNVSMMIDIARQMKLLGIMPKRTIRFALWNGEEQCICGSSAYTKIHEAELDKHLMAMSIDIGSGRIRGFFTGARPDLLEKMDEAMAPVAGFGPFENEDIPIIGTDNYDFMIQGVPNLVGKHDGPPYCADYHCESDTYDKVDFPSLKINSAIVAAVTLGFANMENPGLKRQNREEIQKMIDQTNLAEVMKAFGFYEGWIDGTRGR